MWQKQLQYVYRRENEKKNSFCSVPTLNYSFCALMKYNIKTPSYLFPVTLNHNLLLIQQYFHVVIGKKQLKNFKHGQK